MEKKSSTSYKTVILRFFNTYPNQIYKRRDLAKKLGVPNRDYQVFKQLVKQLAVEEKISRHKGNRYGKYLRPMEVHGVLHVKTAGYGFLIRDDGMEDIFISQRNMGSALHKDRVKVLLWAQSRGKLPEGKVVEILERGHECIVGTFQEARTYYYVIPDELKISRDIYISEKNRRQAQAGHKVVVEISNWGDDRRMPEGRVVKVLGKPGDEGVDVLSVVYGYDLPLKFSKAVLADVDVFSDKIPKSLMKERLDLRDKFIFTIDPEDAKDFDDAVSLDTLPNGHFLLGVHIADVSFFVKSGSGIDREALRRGTSVYLVDRVIPMLPERLSNELCSLNPGEDHLTLSVLMELTPEGELIDCQFKEAVIRSKRRLTYKAVHDMLNEHVENSPDRDLFIIIKQMVELSQKLRARWRNVGSIDFNVPEPEVTLNKRGQAVHLGVKVRYESHEMIEAFMLLANKTIAEHIQYLREKTGRKYPFVFRIHERPKGKKLDNFIQFVQALGHDFNPGKRVTSKKFQNLLKYFQGTSQEIIIEEIALRSMMKAAYSTENAGHFGLAFGHYTHFTSPIRRYPDLIVHRLLKFYLANGSETFQSMVPLSKICDIANEREIKAQEAERESIKAKQVEFMENHIGDEFRGIISGITSFGLFVELPEYLVEGLIQIKDMDDDYYIHDEKKYCLFGQNHGNVYRLGDSLSIRVTRIWRQMRKIDFELVNKAISP